MNQAARALADAVTNPESDDDPDETRDWLEALVAVTQHVGNERAGYLIERQLEIARTHSIPVSSLSEPLNTPYVNSPLAEPRTAANAALERRIEALVRWNALAMVQRANLRDDSLGGHLASFASSATLYEVGFNHFFRARSHDKLGDLVFFQGHASPGIYARAFLQGQLQPEQLDNFRREASGKGLSSYPHPWLMPGFWQFPTVSMGLGGAQAIYQARFMKYLAARGIANHDERRVWCFLGDGEMDEPEGLGMLGVAGREQLDNLVFVVNCNLQRLDGPVRGNGKVIQELERLFRGAGWNVIKLIWGSEWNELLARDDSGLLRRRMDECLDGEYQTQRARDGAHLRRTFFGKYPELAELVQGYSDEALQGLSWGGHDADQVHAAYAAAVRHRGQPSVVLAKTIKGYGMGESGEARNFAHQSKKLSVPATLAFRDRFELTDDLDEARLSKYEYLRPPDSAPEMVYLRQRRDALGGLVPAPVRAAPPLEVPELETLERVLGSSTRMSTTKAFARLLESLLEHEALGPRVVPILADEAQTFGLHSLFRRHPIWSQCGQLYESEDAQSSTPYREDVRGQVLQEGISEAGAMASWLAAATSYATHGVPMIPFFVYYSMFGIQRTGDLWWAAADSRARGFLLGATSGRTTLNGEGLQHQDGHSHVWAAAIPNCIPYDPTFAHEVAVIVQDGLRRMLSEQEDVYFYVTLLNEAYPQPAPVADAASDLLKGMYLLRPAPEDEHGMAPVELLGSGAILCEVLAAAELLRADWDIPANVWSCPSFTLLARDGRATERWNRLHPDAAERRTSHVERRFFGRKGPFVAATDYVRAFAEQIRAFVPGRYVVLGTDGFGRSDTRAELRAFFEVDRHWIAVAALNALVDEGRLEPSVVLRAFERYGLNREKADPSTC